VIDSIALVGSVIVIVSLAYGLQKDKTKIKYYFSKSKKSPEKELGEIIDVAKESIDVAVFYISETKLVSHLCSATNRGVKVRIITDREAETTNKAALDELISVGIPVKVNTYDGRMHLKNMIVDKKFVATGSYNYTHGAENRNEEVLVIIKNKELAKEWDEKFDAMWDDEKNYTTY
jgi:phosphatidylserine/phosphatidylglycerophosphate/cardiolipin synthase-like enzyme